MSKHSGIEIEAPDADAAAEESAYGADAEALFIAEVSGEQRDEADETEAAAGDDEDQGAVDSNADDEEPADSDEEDEGDDSDASDDEDEEEDADDSDDEDEDAEDSEDEDEEDDDGEDDAGADEKIPAKYQSHVAKLIKKTRDKERAKAEAVRRELDELREQSGTTKAEREKLSAELEQLKAAKAVPAPTEDSPYAHVMDVKSLEKEEAQMWAFRRKLMEDPESVKVPDPENPGESRYLEADEARRYLAFVDERIQRDIPRRKEWLQKHEQLDGVLTRFFPDAGKTGTAIQRRIDSIVAEFPQMKLLPGYRNAALAQSVGRELLVKYGSNALKVLEMAAGEPAAKGKDKGKAGKPNLKTKPKSKPKAMSVKPQKKTSALKSTGREVTEDEFADMVATNFVR